MSEHRQLREHLARLRQQLLETPSIDPSTRSRLEQTVAEIEDDLSEARPGSRPNSSLVTRLSEAALDFEASHPTLAGTIGSVIDALAAIGI